MFKGEYISFLTLADDEERRRIWLKQLRGGARQVVTGTPTNAYVAEDGATFYVAEDGSTFYVQEV